VPPGSPVAFAGSPASPVDAPPEPIAVARASVAPPAGPGVRPTRPALPVRAGDGPGAVPNDRLDRDGGPGPAKARDQRTWRLVALVVASLVVLGALPLFFGIRTATRDPVLNSLNALDVPGWAAQDAQDAVSGSRWCLVDCRFRERTAQSQQGPEETTKVYEAALTQAGWRRWEAAKMCPEQPVPGHYTCWTRDELTLDLWVRAPSCAAPPQDGAAPPATPPPAGPGGTCEGSVVSVKVRNAIDDDRVKPGPSTDPSLTGEDPDPVFTDDPLLDDPTPGAS
jgi:integrin beta 3